MRDPGGAIVALAKPGPGGPLPGPQIAWYSLNTADVQRAKANYGELFGWAFAPQEDLGSLGGFHPFAGERGAPLVGSMSDIAGREGVHPHWLFHFRVRALGPAVEAVKGAGGKVFGPFTLPSGEQLAICDDPQGAAFAIRP